MFWTIALFQCIALTCTKMSCLFFYRRIFHTGQNRAFHIATIALIVITGLFGVVFFIAFLTECNGHFSAWWTDIQSLLDYCKASTNVGLAFAVSDSAVDIAVFVIPILEVSISSSDPVHICQAQANAPTKQGNEAENVSGSENSCCCRFLPRWTVCASIPMPKSSLMPI